MRVLHLTTEFPPVIFGGLGTAVGGLVGALAQAGTQVGVLLVGSGVNGYGSSATATTQPAASVTQPVIVAHDVSVFATAWSGAPETALDVCRRWRPDVVHLHVFWLWEIARRIHDELGLPLVYTVHSLDVAEYDLGNGPSECLQQWQVQQAVLAHADVIHAPSTSEADLVARYCPATQDRLAVAGHGIDDPHGVPSRNRHHRDGPTTVLFVGRFVDRKGIRELLAAIPTVLEQAPDTRFVLSGGHRGVTAAEMRAHWLPDHLARHQDQVCFTGWLSPEATADWYAQADILVIPSWYEPFGMVVLEGMLEAIAIAASDVGGPGEILEHEQTALLFAPRDPASLASTVARLATDPGLRQRLGTNAAQDVRRNWLWPSAAAKMQHIYTHATTTACEVAA
ncbi:MAG: glycosyltransferase family 4 protein [Solirubrobacteraceae bacterium]